jgi:hypothetical protein
MSVYLVTRESSIVREYDTLKPFLITPGWSEIAQSVAKSPSSPVGSLIRRSVEGLPQVE